MMRVRGWNSCGQSVRWDSISSQVLEPIGLKLGRLIKGMHENVPKKKFFGSVNVDRGQVFGPQVPLLGRGDGKGMMGLVDRTLPMMRLANIYKVARDRSVDHRSLF